MWLTLACRVIAWATRNYLSSEPSLPDYQSASLQVVGLRMPIRPFLAGQAFEPEAINAMSLALERACSALSLSLVDDPATRLVAEKIIEFAQGGIRDPEILSSMALEYFLRK